MKSNTRKIELQRVLRHVDRPHLARSGSLPFLIFDMKETKSGQMRVQFSKCFGIYDKNLKAINYQTPFIGAELVPITTKHGTIQEMRDWIAGRINEWTGYLCGKKKRDSDFIKLLGKFRGKCFDEPFPPVKRSIPNPKGTEQ